MARYKLKLKRLDFVSVVDRPAQEPATCLLIKRAGNASEIEAMAMFVKADPKLGLAFFWAVTDADADGNPYHDLQGDQVLADDDLVKSAMEFMERGGAVDQQHDSTSIGKTIFAMPMTPEIAKIYGVTTKRHGLMVAVKPKPDVLAKLISGEYTGVSIAGLGEREEVAAKGAARKDAAEPAPRKGSPSDDDLESHLQDLLAALSDEDIADIGTLAESMHAEVDEPSEKRLRKSRFSTLSDKLADKGATNPDALAAYIGRKKYGAEAFSRMASRGRRKKRFAKMVVLTSVEDGHQHAIDLDDPADWCGDKLCTSPATSAGAEMSHTHAWTFDHKTGDVTIAMDSGHSHTVAEAVPQNVLSMFAIDEQQEAQQDAQRLLEQVLDGNAGGDVTVTIAARAISTPSATARKGGLTRQEHTMPDAKDLQIADLTKRAERAERVAKMGGAHKSHFDTLSGDDAEAFLAKTAAEREAIVQKALEDDKPIWTGEVTKVAVRRRDGELALQLAKQNEANAAALAKREAEIEKAEVAQVAKEHLGHLAGSDEVHQLIVGALRKSGADKAKIDEALTAMKGWNALGKAAEKVKGVNPGSDAQPGSPLEAYEKGLVEFAKSKGKTPNDVADQFLSTPQGQELYAAYVADHPGYRAGQPRQ